MAIEIKPLSPEMAELFTDYVANLDFHHAPHWHFAIASTIMSNVRQKPGAAGPRK